MLKKLLAILLLTSPCLAQSLPAGGGMVFPKGGGAAPTVIQSLSTGTTAATSGLILSSPVTIGNILIVVMYSGPASITLTFTDTFLNTPTALASTTLSTDDDKLTIGCAPITATGGADTVSFFVNGVSANITATIYEVHNSTGACTQDVTAVHSNTLSATSCNSGPMTTTTANDLLIGACGLDGTITSGSIAAGTGWSGGLNAGVTAHPAQLMSEYRAGTTAGSYTATSGTIASEEQATLLVALKP